MRIGGTSGSTSPTGYEVQKSLLELLTLEDSLVKQLNTANHAFVVASKTATRITEYKKNIEVISNNLENTRREIQLYFMNVLGIHVGGMIAEEKPTSGQAYVKREQMIASLYEK